MLVLLMTAGCKRVRTELDTYLIAAHELWGFEGAALVAWNGHVVLSSGYGTAFLPTGEPNTPHTKFFIGSITKQFTAAAILKLNEQGLVDLHAPISRYLPEYPRPNGDRITIHHLLTHTSGTPEYAQDLAVVLRRTQPMLPAELMSRFAGRPLEFEPGTRFKYSNSGYIVLGAIIERVSGQSYEAYLHRRIFKPAGMISSGYARREAGLPERAEGYTLGDERRLVSAIPLHFSVLHSAGALYSTVEDMLKWNNALHSHEVLDQQSLDFMFTAHAGNYGYGWFVDTLWGTRHAYHGGFLDGFNVYIDDWEWMGDRLCIVVFSNDDDAPVRKIARGLAAILRGRKHDFPVKKTPVAVDSGILAEYEGMYDRTDSSRQTVIARRGRLYAQVDDQPREMLHAQAPDTFFFDLDNTRTITFIRDAQHNVVALTVYDDGSFTQATRTTAGASERLPGADSIPLDPIACAEYVGTYQLDEDIHPGFYLTVICQGNRLIAQATSTEAIELWPRGTDEFSHIDVDLTLTFIRDADSRVSGCALRMGRETIAGVRIR